jgi:release factor glutamine methyltransferase
VHSSVCGLEPTVRRLEEAGLAVDVLERRRGARGPRRSARAPVLEARGILAPGQREEDMLVVKAAA